MTSLAQKLLGHRGARGERLENSAIGFDYAQRLQTHGQSLAGVEFDIQMTADGNFVVVHDETLARLSDAQSWVMDKTMAELPTIVQSDRQRFAITANTAFLGQKILPLDELLPYLSSYRHIELEIKTHIKSHAQALVKNLLRLLSNAQWQQLPITLTSFDTAILYQLQNQQQSLPKTQRFATGLLLEPHTEFSSQIAFCPNDKTDTALIYQTFNHACALGCAQVGVYHPLITPNLVAIAKQLGLKVTAWTVNEIETAKTLDNMGVDWIISDYPAKFLSAD